MTRHYDRTAVRASLVHFVFGKAFNGAVSVLTLVCLARWLDTSDYGSYIALVALQATLLAVSNLGIETTSERFLPEFRTRYEDEKLFGFVLASLVARLLTLLVVALIGTVAAGLLSSWMGLSAQRELLRYWLVAVVGYGVLSFGCVLLEAMLKQKHAQACMSVYLGTKLVLIAALHMAWQLDLELLIASEVVASLGSAVLALTLLTRQFHLSGLVDGWRLVVENRDRLRRFAIFNYAAQCVFQLFSTDILKLLVTRLIGVAGSASYGFAASLADMVQRYLPATLLQRMIKPVFVSRYVRSGDFNELNQLARIILKLNLLILVPVIAMAIVYGAELLDVLTKGKYVDAHWLFVGALCLLIPFSHQAILSLMAGTLERNGMQFYAGIFSGVGFPVALVLIPRMGPIGALVAAALSGLIYNVFATVYLRWAGYDYRPDWRALGIFSFAGCLLTIGLLVSKIWLFNVSARLAALVLLTLGYLLLVRRLSAFSTAERSTLNAVLPKPLFVF